MLVVPFIPEVEAPCFAVILYPKSFMVAYIYMVMPMVTVDGIHVGVVPVYVMEPHAVV